MPLQSLRMFAVGISLVVFAGVPSAARCADETKGFPTLQAGTAHWRADPQDVAGMRRDVETTEDGKTVHWSGVPLAAVLAKVATLEASLHGATLREVVRVRGSDGYVATFALAELDPSLGDRTPFLVDRRDGQPLAAGEGPWRLVVPQDRREARWVRDVTAVDVGDGLVLDDLPAIAPMSEAECDVWNRERGFAASVEQHDAAAFAGFVAQNATFDAGSTEPIHGRAAIVEAWKDIITGQSIKLRWSPGMVTIGGDGRFAISHGPAWIDDDRPDSKTPRRVGEFVSTWMRESDGQWRVLFDAGAVPMHVISAADAAALVASLPKQCPRS